MKKTKANFKASGKSGTNQLRIIGGQWRGRKLNFADGEGLRPTMDRVRETLFNWLQSEIVGARCLDLFSGSGALGLEALSRHASEVVMIDKNPRAIGMIQRNLDLLDVNNAQLLRMDARGFLQRAAEDSLLQTAEGSLLRTAEGSLLRTDEGSLLKAAEGSLPKTAEGSLLPTAEGSSLQKNETFDIVFLDPPFNKQLVAPFCELLAQSNCLSQQASIYIEMEKNAALPELPPGWNVVREKKAGQLAYYLIVVDS